MEKRDTWLKRPKILLKLKKWHLFIIFLKINFFWHFCPYLMSLPIISRSFLFHFYTSSLLFFYTLSRDKNQTLEFFHQRIKIWSKNSFFLSFFFKIITFFIFATGFLWKFFVYIYIYILGFLWLNCCWGIWVAFCWGFLPFFFFFFGFL